MLTLEEHNPNVSVLWKCNIIFLISTTFLTIMWRNVLSPRGVWKSNVWKINCDLIEYRNEKISISSSTYKKCNVV